MTVCFVYSGGRITGDSVRRTSMTVCFVYSGGRITGDKCEKDVNDCLFCLFRGPYHG